MSSVNTLSEVQMSSRKTCSRRQFVAGAMAASTAVAGLSAWRGVAHAQSTSEITMWGFPLTQNDAELFRPIQQAFEKQNPTIKVNVQIEPWTGRENKMLAAIAAGNPPDAVYLNSDFYPEFVAADALVALDDILGKAILADYLPGPVSAVSYSGKVFGLPILSSAYVELYNKQLIEKAGITTEPTTWDTFRAAVEKVNKPSSGTWGAYYALNRPSPVSTFVPFLWMAGGEMFNAAGTEVAFGGAEGEAALDYLVSFYTGNLVQKANINGGGLPFSAGKTGYMIQVDSTDIQNALKDNPKLQLGITPMLKDKKQINFGTIGSYSVFRKSKYPEAAAKWIQFLTNPENTTTILKASGFISPRKSIPASAYLSSQLFQQIAAQAPLTKPEPKNIHAREVYAAMQPRFQAAYLGSTSVKEALKQAVDAANSQMKS